jgi:hypothetical protein
MSMEKKLAHLEMIQAVINRMSANSFSLKGWSVVLVSALFALSATDTNAAFIYLAYFPAIAFWMLDGYYLWKERQFRELFDQVRHLDESEIDFSMDVSDLRKSGGWAKAALSKTQDIYYGTIIASIVVVMITLIATSG